MPKCFTITLAFKIRRSVARYMYEGAHRNIGLYCICYYQDDGWCVDRLLHKGKLPSSLNVKNARVSIFPLFFGGGVGLGEGLRKRDKMLSSFGNITVKTSICLSFPHLSVLIFSLLLLSLSYRIKSRILLSTSCVHSDCLYNSSLARLLEMHCMDAFLPDARRHSSQCSGRSYLSLVNAWAQVD
jgi:hypothetical protein